MTSSWYRRQLWQYKGMREYTKSGFNYAKKNFKETDLEVDCAGRNYLITGCNSGIGLETALEIARRGGVLHMVCRDVEAARAARSRIITETGNDKLHVHQLDLSNPGKVAAWANDFSASHEHLHVLIHNAGCTLHERVLDSNGVEGNFAVNTLSIHILTMVLLPLLQRSEDARVIMVSSAGMLTVRLDAEDLMFENMSLYNGTLAYSQNKRQQVTMTLAYAMRYDKVHFSSMHPGWADTPAVRMSIPQFYESMKEVLRTASQGADTVVWLAISKEAVQHPSGLFFQDRVPVATHLPLAWTHHTPQEEEQLLKKLNELYFSISNDVVIAHPQSRAALPAAFDTAESEIKIDENSPLDSLQSPTNEIKAKISNMNETLETTAVAKITETIDVIDSKFIIESHSEAVSDSDNLIKKMNALQISSTGSLSSITKIESTASSSTVTELKSYQEFESVPLNDEGNSKVVKIPSPEKSLESVPTKSIESPNLEINTEVKPSSSQSTSSSTVQALSVSESTVESTEPTTNVEDTFLTEQESVDNIITPIPDDTEKLIQGVMTKVSEPISSIVEDLAKADLVSLPPMNPPNREEFIPVIVTTIGEEPLTTDKKTNPELIRKPAVTPLNSEESTPNTTTTERDESTPNTTTTVEKLFLTNVDLAKPDAEILSTSTQANPSEVTSQDTTPTVTPVTKSE